MISLAKKRRHLYYRDDETVARVTFRSWHTNTRCIIYQQNRMPLSKETFIEITPFVRWLMDYL